MNKQIKVGQVLKVYSGKPDGCMCGCRGKYYYPSDKAGLGSKERGYEVGADEISDRMVKKVVKMMNESLIPVTQEDDWFELAIENRKYVIWIEGVKS